MTARAKAPDVFGAALEALRAVYEAEVARLADAYRPRIVAGEFSGLTGFDQVTGRRGPEQGDPAFMRLEEELSTSHRWLRTKRGRLAVAAVSRWIASGSVSVENGAMEQEVGDCAAECMSHDVLAVAARRGWVGSFREPCRNAYAVKAA